MEDGRPLEADSRHVVGQHVLATRSDAALDPRDEIVECLLTRLAVLPYSENFGTR